MKKIIALLSGGNSSEFEISIKSGTQVASYIDHSKYEVYPIVLRGKDWYWNNKKGERVPIDKNDFSLRHDGKHIRFDCVFIAIHGTPGEDGKLQAYFDLLNIPYTSCGRLTSALTFNKYFCKNYLAGFGIPIARSLLITDPSRVDHQHVIKELGLPCFVKPNEGGSSFGVSKVKHESELGRAIEIAFREDRQIVIESYIKGTEITCGLIKTRKGEMIFPVTEIVSKKEFFDYEAKYMDGLSEEITPARIPEEKRKECQELSSRIYSILQCKGVVRIDFILSGNRLYFLEVNSIPGMTAESIVPKQAAAYGLSLSELYSLIIEEAFASH
jgi:D-alanine-D-alanine ligase